MLIIKDIGETRVEMKIKQLSHSKQTHLFFTLWRFLCFTLTGKDADPAVHSVVARHDLELAPAYKYRMP